jgi:hypothetical protein
MKSSGLSWCALMAASLRASVSSRISWNTLSVSGYLMKDQHRDQRSQGGHKTDGGLDGDDGARGLDRTRVGGAGGNIACQIPFLTQRGTPAKPQLRNVTGQFFRTTRRQHTFLLLSLDVGTVRGSRTRERIRGHDFDRIAVLGQAERCFPCARLT